MSVIYTRTPTALSLVIDFAPTVIPSSHPNFQKISELVKDPKTTEDQITALLDIPKAIETITSGNVTVINGKLFYKGFEVRSALAKFILKLINSGETETANSLQLFMDNAFSNPDPRAGQELYDWVVDSGLPITSDGHILAWKAVREDYFSVQSGPRGRLDHSIGNVVEEPRHETNANPDITCSRGLHFCSAPYLKHYTHGGHRVIAVKINPRDVVAFPRDYEWQKGRACRYEVVGEVPMERVAEFYPQGRAVYSGFDKPVAVAATPKTPRNKFGFAVGQVWSDASGSKETILSIDSEGEYPVETEIAYYTASGKFITGTDGSSDLVTLISDVA